MFIKIILSCWQTYFSKFRWFKWVSDTLFKVSLFMLTFVKIRSYFNEK